MIIRKNKTRNYSLVDNALWTDKRLSVSARFILGFMLSLPDDWRFNLSWMAKQIGMNRDTVGKYVQELIDNGFIMRERVRHDDGTFGDYEYTIYEEPALNADNQQIAGQAIFEIGRRLKHVKEHDLTHGEFGKWLESVEIDRTLATRLMKVASELGGGKYATLHNLGTIALYEIATMSEEQRNQPHTIPSTGEQKTVDEMTVKEPAASTCADNACAEDLRTTKSKENNTYNKHVVEQAANIIEYPSVIIETLSRHNLKPNAATLKRWLSLASEEVIVQVIEYAAGRNVRSVIGYITAVLQQGWTAPSFRCVSQNERVKRQPVKRDILPDYVQRQISGEVRPAGELSEEQRQEASELLRMLGEY